MPESPRAACVEDYSEDAQDVILGTKQSANVAAKRSKPEIRNMKRSEVGNSGHSSHGVVIGDSSQGLKKGSTAPTKNGLLKGIKKVAGAAMWQSSKEPSTVPRPAPKHSMSRTQKKENLRLDTRDSRADAAKIHLSGLRRESSPDPPPLRRPRPEIHGPPSPQSIRTPTSGQAQSIPISYPAQHLSRPCNAVSHGSRPASYHGGHMWESAYTHAPLAAQPPPMPLNGYPPQSYPPPPMMLIPTPLPTSPNRQIAYPFPPTAPPAYEHPYIPPPTNGWRSEIYHQHPPPRSQPRPVSMQSSGSFGEYPSIPLGYHPVPPHHSTEPPPRRLSVHQFEPQPMFPLEDESHILEDSEAFYRRQMPPPPRPSIRHAATTTNAREVSRRSKRDSLDLISQPPRKQSLDETRPTSRPSLSSRSNSSKNQAVIAEAPAAPTAIRRRPRPISYHGGVPELERRAEEYQAATTGNARPYLTADDIQKAKGRKSTKTHRSGGGSDAGSRASSGRGSSSAKRKKSPEKHKGNSGGDEGFSVRFPAGQALKLDLRGEEPRTISLRQSMEGHGGMELNIKQHNRPRDADGIREREKVAMERRHSVAGRRDIRQIKESGEQEGSRRTRSRSGALGGEVTPTSGTDADDVLVERFRRLKADARTRRSSSRSLIPPIITQPLEGQMI